LTSFILRLGVDSPSPPPGSHGSSDSSPDSSLDPLVPLYPKGEAVSIQAPFHLRALTCLSLLQRPLFGTLVPPLKEIRSNFVYICPSRTSFPASGALPDLRLGDPIPLGGFGGRALFAPFDSRNWPPLRTHLYMVPPPRPLIIDVFAVPHPRSQFFPLLVVCFQHFRSQSSHPLKNARRMLRVFPFFHPTLSDVRFSLPPLSTCHVQSFPFFFTPKFTGGNANSSPVFPMRPMPSPRFPYSYFVPFSS